MAAAATVLAYAFWRVGKDAALRRGLTPGSLPLILPFAAAVAGARGPTLPVLAALGGALAAGAIDARTGAIPDPLSVATALVALVFASLQHAFVPGLGGALLAGGALLVLHASTAGRGLGLGDVKLGAAIGAGFGPTAGIAAIAAAFVLGAIVASWLLLTRRTRLGRTIRFGPFLAAGACCAALAPAGIPW
jgi:leader peptidase (prepilin peptidase) / N-methyltransferase